MSINLLGNTVYLTLSEWNTLESTGTVTLASGTKITYSDNDTYIVPESIDTTPTLASLNPVTSNGVKVELNKGIVGLSVSGRIITYTKADGSTGTLTTQDNNTTYSVFGKSGSTHSVGLVPDPGATVGTKKFLREDGTWVTPTDTNTTYNNMTGATASASGSSGLVPAPSAGYNTKFLRGDGTWASLPSSLPASDVYAWAKASAKPVYTWTEITSKPTFASVATSGSYNDLSNKPTIPTIPSSLPASDVSIANGVITIKGTSITPLTQHQSLANYTLTSRMINGHALTSDVTVSKSDVGLGNVTNDSQVKRSEMGIANGVATLDTNGKVPSTQLPSYVDDVLEYTAKANFPTTGEAGKIYIDKTTNMTWRWSGTTYVAISSSLALGENASTAYAGNKGKANADAIANIISGAQSITGNITTGNIGSQSVAYASNSGTVNNKTVLSDVPANAKFTDTIYSHQSYTAVSSGLYKIGRDSQGHVVIGDSFSIPTTLPASDVYSWAKQSTKPSYTKSEIGLSDVDNTSDANKSVAYATSAGKATGDKNGNDIATTYHTISDFNTKYNSLVATANGKCKSYAMSCAAISGTKNSLLNATNDSITISYTSQDIIMPITNAPKQLKDLDIGDIILITETGIPDRWVASNQDNTLTLCKMETSKIDLTSYVLTESLSGVALSGSYNDLSDKPTIPTSLPASDVYSWAKQISKPTYSYDELTGKPTLFSGSYNDLTNKPTIPAAYTLPTATSTTLGGVKTGSNITNSSGIISLTSSNVTTALGFTPAKGKIYTNSAGTTEATSTKIYMSGSILYINIA